MSKTLNSKQDVIEWYWIDFLDYCQVSLEHSIAQLGYKTPVEPTEDNFWKWYISDNGPLGVKKNMRFYSKTDVEYA